MNDAELIAGFRAAATASVADAVDKIAGRAGCLPPEFAPRINDKKIVGPAVTVLEGPTTEFVPPQHALEAIDASDPGAIIVISTNGSTDVAVWGGLIVGVNLPLLVIISVLVGFLPTFVACRLRLAALRRRQVAQGGPASNAPPAIRNAPAPPDPEPRSNL